MRVNNAPDVFSRHGRRTWQRGFTLIELMVAVAVVAILAMIAVPSYSKYVLKANRRNAQAAMMDLAQREAQYLLDARSYGTYNTTTNNLNWSVPQGVSGIYTITATPTAGPPPGYTITATPVSGTSQVNDPCGNLTLDNTGLKGVSGTSSVSSCW